MPSWRQVLEAVAEAWERARATRSAPAPGGSRSACGAARCCEPSDEPLDASAARRRPWSGLRERLRPAQRRLRRRAQVPARVGDRVPAAPRRGGHGARTRCGRWRRAASTTRWAAGSRRYSVDAHWLVPHFEKMLYDNALLARAYLHGWQVTRRPAVPATSPSETLDWALREMRAPRGRLLLGARRRLRGRGGQLLRLDARRAARGRWASDADEAIAWFGATERGNFEGAQHPRARRRASPRRLPRVARARCTRSAPQRVWPGLDDKRLTVLERADDLGAGRRGRRARARRLPGRRARARRVRARASCATPSGRLLRTWKDGQAQAQRLPRGPRLPASRRCSRSTRRPSSRAGSPRRASWPTP